MDERKQIQILIDYLVALCERGSVRYNKLAKVLRNPELKLVFRIYSEQRKAYAQELLQCAPTLEGFDDPTAPLHFRVKEPAVIDETRAVRDCEERERQALNIYRDALQMDCLPLDLKEVIASQAKQIGETCQYLGLWNHRNLSDQHTAAQSVAPDTYSRA